MCLKTNKIKNSNRNENSLSDFLSSPFFPVMANVTAGSSAWKSASQKLDKRETLESKFLRASSKRISSLQETVPLLNQCMGEENLKRRF